MRPDVKLGVVMSMAVVLIAGGYYFYKDRGETPIPVASGPESGAASTPVATKKVETPGSDSLTAGHRKPTLVNPRHRVAEKPGQTPADGTAARPSPRIASRHPAAQPHNRATQPVAKHGNSVASAPTKADADKAGRVGKGAVQPQRTGGQPHPRIAQRTPVAKPSLRASASPRTEKKPEENKVAAANPPARSERQGQGPTTAHRSVPLVARGSQPPHRTPATNPNRSDPAVETHRVQPGDTMSLIAQEYYGSTKYTQFLIKGNPQIADPGRLRVGMTVKIPERPSDVEQAAASGGPAKKSAGGAGRTYRVQAGDTFYEIAKSQLGDASRWKELFELNRAVVHGDPKRLQIGNVLELPAAKPAKGRP